MRCSLVLLSVWAFSLSAEIKAFYLSWYEDPTSTMTVQWISDSQDEEDSVFLLQEEKWVETKGSHKTLYETNFHHATLRNLAPGTEYSFRIGKNESYKFKTAPANLDQPMRFVIGGDVYQTKKLFRKMNEAVVQKDPLFCALGGDLAYAFQTVWHLRSDGLHRWISFLAEWQRQLVTPEGRVIPMLVTSGNHDLDANHFELFFHLFALSEKRIYRSLNFGDYLSLVFLDTNHFDPIEGKQTTWLKQALQKSGNFPYVFAIYHEGAYPSYYPYEGTIPEKVRTYWCPLFDEYRISAAFENHSHAFKQTYPLRNHEKHPDGIIYFGDGCWGSMPRKTHNHWYLEKRARKNHVYVVKLSEREALIEAIDLKGLAFEKTPLKARTDVTVRVP